MWKSFSAKIAICCLLTISPVNAAEDLLDLGTKAVLEKHCSRCHSEASTNLKAKKDIPNILDVDDLIARKMVVPGQPEISKIWTEVDGGTMPDDASDDPINKYPSVAEKETLKAFVIGLKNKVISTEEKRIFLTDGDILKYIFDDIAQTSQSQAKERRYFLLTHLHNNSSITSKNLESHRLALAKMLNSLSWKRNIIKPVAVDPERTIFRIDLREIGWTKERWEKLAAIHPYNKFYDNVVGASLAESIGANVPAIRADWFVAKTSKPPLYHDFAQIPENVVDLEKKLLFGGLTATDNRLQNPFEVARAGVRVSGVSLQNRMIERHPSQFGAYWLSFDFKKADPADALAARKDFFRFPTGPGGETGFLHDGGEFIFNLPNGFQAYMLADANGKRIDAGPTDIVFDRNAAAERRDPTIVNGFSCISCHAAGMNKVTDELLPEVQSSAFDLATKDQVALLHNNDRIVAGFAEDEDRFKRAMTSAGITDLSVSQEPISKIVFQFENVLVDFKAAAAELGLRENEFKNAMSRLESDPQLLGIKRQLEGQGMPREQFIAAFDAIARAIRIHRDVPTNYALSSILVKKNERIQNSINEQLEILNTRELKPEEIGLALNSMQSASMTPSSLISGCNSLGLFVSSNSRQIMLAPMAEVSKGSSDNILKISGKEFNMNTYYTFCLTVDTSKLVEASRTRDSNLIDAMESLVGREYR